MKTVDSGAKLIIVCGLPGSGKTTHAKHLQAGSRGIRLCPDEWMDASSKNGLNERIALSATIDEESFGIHNVSLLVFFKVLLHPYPLSRNQNNPMSARSSTASCSIKSRRLRCTPDNKFRPGWLSWLIVCQSLVLPPAGGPQSSRTGIAT
jgi:hypothetical protein